MSTIRGTEMPTTSHANDELLTITEVAAMVRVPEATLRYWRHLRTGPHSFRIGRSVRYWRTEVSTGSTNSPAIHRNHAEARAESERERR